MPYKTSQCSVAIKDVVIAIRRAVVLVKIIIMLVLTQFIIDERFSTVSPLWS
jgi:hypothetical protein